MPQDKVGHTIGHVQYVLCFAIQERALMELRARNIDLCLLFLSDLERALPAICKTSVKCTRFKVTFCFAKHKYSSRNSRAT